MINITLAKTAGFCFGVKRAVDTAKEELEKNEGKHIYSIGPIIHNEIVTEYLKSKGLVELNDANIINKLANEKVVIRSHGIEKKILEKLKENNNEIIDLTCPFVKKIHNLVFKYANDGYFIIVVGDKNHPEVKGIVSYANKNIEVINTVDDIKASENIAKLDKNANVLVVFQTTSDIIKSKNIVEKLKNLFYNIIVENTICNATNERQKEVEELSKNSEYMFIIGSSNSSNTKKLYDISKKNCERTYLISEKKNLLNINIKDEAKLGVSAGASTPNNLIEEIIKTCQSYHLNNY